jgi:hypothetical protein
MLMAPILLLMVVLQFSEVATGETVGESAEGFTKEGRR